MSFYLNKPPIKFHSQTTWRREREWPVQSVFSTLVLAPALPSLVSCGPHSGSPVPGRPHLTAGMSLPPPDWDHRILPLWLPGTLSGWRLLSVKGTKVKIWLKSPKADKVYASEENDVTDVYFYFSGEWFWVVSPELSLLFPLNRRQEVAYAWVGRCWPWRWTPGEQSHFRIHCSQAVKATVNMFCSFMCQELY